MFRLETKIPWHQTPSRKKKAVIFTNVTVNAYQGQLNARFSKVCETFKVRSLESLKYIRERDAEQNKLWLVVWYVSQMASRAGLGQ